MLGAVPEPNWHVTRVKGEWYNEFHWQGVEWVKCPVQVRNTRSNDNGRAFVLPQPGESSKAFHAFGHYRDIPADMRSIAAAYRDHLEQCKQARNRPKTAPGFWRKWRSKYNWVDRVKAHDADLSRQICERFAP